MPFDGRTADPLGRWSVLLFLLTVAGCSPSDTARTAPPPPAGPRTSEARPSPPIERPVPPDRSMDADAYIAMGMPAPDRVWSVEDMAKAADVLAGIAAQDGGQLPRSRSPRSGRIYDRITSPEDLGQFRDRLLPLGVRLPRAMDYLAAANRLLKLYYAHFAKHEVGDGDMVGILAILLRTTAVACGLLGEFLPTLDKDAPDYATRMQGLETTRRGLGGIAIGSLMTLTEKDAYGPAARARLLDVMIETMPSIFPWLLPGSQAEMTIRLEQMSADPGLAGLKPGWKTSSARYAASRAMGQASASASPRTLADEQTGAWSRRLEGEHRPIYLVRGHRVEFLRARYHY